MAQQEAYLIDKSKEGDITSFEELIIAHQKKAFNIAYRMLGNLEDANDVTQEAILKVYRSISKFKENSSFSTWFYSIVNNTCIDFIRKNRKSNVIYLDKEYEENGDSYKKEISDTESHTPETALEKKEVRKLVHDSINQLSPEQRKIIVLRDINGFSYQEIAEILNCSEGTVKSRISRARANLKSIIQNKLAPSNGKEGNYELFKF